MADDAAPGTAASAADGTPAGAGPGTPAGARPVAPGRLVVRTERLRGPIRAGLALALVGLAVVIASGITISVVNIGQAVFANDREQVGTELTFDGDGGEYGLLLIVTPITSAAFTSNPETYVDCTGQRPDGTSFTVKGSAALTRTETDAGFEIGRFTTTAGTTAVTCDWNDPARNTVDVYYSVAPSSIISTIATVVLVLGIALILVGVGLLIRGLRGRAVTERVPGGGGTHSPDSTRTALT